MNSTMVTRRTIIRIAIALAAAIAAIAAHRIINIRPHVAQSNYSAAHLQTAMDEHYLRIDELISHIADSIRNSPAADTLAIVNDAAAESGYSVYLFRNGHLAAWHNALIPVANISPKALSARILRTDNGWYYSAGKRYGAMQIFATLRIRSHYPYDNEYLRTAFHPSLGIDNRSRLTTDSCADGAKLTDAQGKYIFSIQQRDSSRATPALVAADAACLAVWFVAIITAIMLTVKLIAASKAHSYAPVAALALLAGVYVWALNINISDSMSTWFIFSSQVFAYNVLMPSLGMVLLFSLLMLLWCYMAFRHVSIADRYANAIQRHSGAVFFALLLMIYSIYASISTLTNILVYHATDLSIYIDNLDLTGPTLAKIVIKSFNLLSFIFIIEWAYTLVYKYLSWQKFATCLAVFYIAIVAPSALAMPWFTASFYIGFGAFNILYFALKRTQPLGIQFSRYVWLILASATLLIVRLTELNTAKEWKNRSLLINNLSFELIREDDPVAESLLLNIDGSIAADSVITSAFNNASGNVDENVNIYSYLRERYFDGYFSRYDLQVVPCKGVNSNIQMTNSGEEFNCYSYFNNMLTAFGSRIAPKSNFYCLNDNDGRASYFGEFRYFDKRKQSWDRLYIEINARPYSSAFGYPELLTNSRDRINKKQLKGYSYAKYYNGNLATHYGDYKYPRNSEWLSSLTDSTHLHTEANHYSHLAIEAMPNQIIVLSYPKLTAAQLIADLSFLFLSLFTVCSLTLLVTGRRTGYIFHNMPIHERTQSAFVLFAMALLVLFCMVFGMQSISHFEKRSSQLLTDNLQSITKILNHEYGNYRSLQGVPSDDIDNMLQQAASLFVSDAHIYSPQGELLGTSRRELFDNKITAPIINSEALEALRNNSDEIFIKESIGELVYYSVYSPLVNIDNQVIGYINIPFFDDVNAISKQLMLTLLPITNSYMLIILLAVLFSYFLANRITKPLISISEGLRKVGLRKNNEKLHYPSHDEIGHLVEEYNSMLDELADSAEKLAANERELTWREMAKQIAHEIKNPLTPMKLSVQYLIRAWDEQRADFDTFIRKVANTLVEQIDQLSATASCFSNLAKLTDSKEVRRIDAAERLSNAVSLFGRTDEATIRLRHGAEHAYILIDGDQLTSVYNNLLKNAIQAAHANEHITIEASIEEKNGTVTIAISDNGHGIAPDVQEKIFKPNFTTKSTGMGLGLAIVRTIVLNANGKIWFETAEGKGTTFYLSFPSAVAD